MNDDPKQGSCILKRFFDYIFFQHKLATTRRSWHEICLEIEIRLWWPPRRSRLTSFPPIWKCIHCNSKIDIRKNLSLTWIFCYCISQSEESSSKAIISALVVVAFLLPWLASKKLFKVQNCRSSLNSFVEACKPFLVCSEKLVIRVILAWFVIQCEFHVGKRLVFYRVFKQVLDFSGNFKSERN